MPAIGFDLFDDVSAFHWFILHKSTQKCLVRASLYVALMEKHPVWPGVAGGLAPAAP
jgi:hypothetical protein